MDLDVVIFGGGAAGLWLLDDLVRVGARALLLEANELGTGQTACAQGILHGGLKYSLGGRLTSAAKSVSQMPSIWRECLAGRREPDLSRTRVRSDCCYLWRTGSLAARLGFWAACRGLAAAPEPLTEIERPPLLAGVSGAVARLDEQVLSPVSLVENLFERNRSRIVKIDAERGLQFTRSARTGIGAIQLRRPSGDARIELHPRFVVLSAGSGNARLRSMLGLDPAAMQRRPLHMVMVRGELPQFNGHCIEGSATRVTITSDTDSAGRAVWQIGGQIAEKAIAMSAAELVPFARSEIGSVLPGFNLGQLEWGTYRVDRADRAVSGGRRPNDVQLLREANVITAWPTKLVLAPRLSEAIRAEIGDLSGVKDGSTNLLPDWPRPGLAAPPWEIEKHWQPRAAVRAPHFSLHGTGLATLAPNRGE